MVKADLREIAENMLDDAEESMYDELLDNCDKAALIALAIRESMLSPMDVIGIINPELAQLYKDNDRLEKRIIKLQGVIDSALTLTNEQIIVDEAENKFHIQLKTILSGK